MKPEDIVLYLGIALAISEGLALIPAVESNSIFTLIYNVLKGLAGAFKPSENKLIK